MRGTLLAVRDEVKPGKYTENTYTAVCVGPAGHRTNVQLCVVSNGAVTMHAGSACRRRDDDGIRAVKLISWPGRALT